MGDNPSAGAPFENSQKRWATYIEMLKLDIGLAGGLLGAFALVFSDPTKVPGTSEVGWLIAYGVRRSPCVWPRSFGSIAS